MFGSKKDEMQVSNGDNITLIGANSTIEGNITAKAYVKIDGKVIGNLNIDGSITLGEDGIVNGDIISGEVIVYGKIEGNVRADTLHLKPTALILGNIEAKTLQIEPGAVYQGSVTMQQMKQAPQMTNAA